MISSGIRSGFEYAFRPFEIAGEVVARPVSQVWKGVTQVDDLEDEVARLRGDRRPATPGRDRRRQRPDREPPELRDLLDIESVANFDLVRRRSSVRRRATSTSGSRSAPVRPTASGSRMPVVNSTGLVQVNLTTAVVMLATDPQYHVPVKVVAEIPAAELIEEPVTTTPSGVPVDELDGSSTTSTTSTTTSTSTSTTTTTTLPDPATFPGSTLPEELTTPVDTTTTSTTTTTTTTLPPVIITRETGVLDGYGGDRLPRVRFIADSPQFGRIEPGDAVLTSGGSESLAPPNIPVGRVANVISNAGTQGLELEVELNADLDRLNFLTVVLYLPPQGSSLN
ncbi:MAG: rod shape-determining protein MreC [Ilumatobacteraceae bacterium]